MKIEKREIKFSCGVIAWIFLLIFYFNKIERKWLAKDSFSAKNQKDMEIIFREVQKSFRKYDNVIINRGYSNKILLDFPDSYFDWIYIDGNHEYEFVLQDLSLGFLKLKPNGFLVGDDYNWKPEKNYPVKRAVKYFLKLNGLDDKLKVIGSQFIIELQKTN